MYLVKTPKLVQKLLPNFHWKISADSKQLYLTFDDGPIPVVTPWILEQLKEFDAKATFFCVGENVHKHPHIYERVLAEGHRVGNHTYNHFNGWSTGSREYCHNVRKCTRLVKSSLFRPPYGKLLPSQAKFLHRHFDIIMWDVLSGDFDPAVSPQECLQNVINNAQQGSIIVFHDSWKAFDKIKFALPKVLSHFTEQGYQFSALSDDVITQNFPLEKSA